MANKRMFSMQIVDSGFFLEMPLSTQCLYFHLNMRADDDGFVDNWRQILRMIGATDDDVKILLAKKFIIAFDSGVIVIKHWRLHNTLQNDRYHPTPYTDEMNALNLKENKAYTLMETECFQNGSSDKIRLGLDKTRLDKYRKEGVGGNPVKPSGAGQVLKERFDIFWKAYPKKVGKGAAEKAWAKIKPSEALLSEMTLKIDIAKKSRQWQRDNGQYIPNPATWLNQKRWEDGVECEMAEVYY